MKTELRTSLSQKKTLIIISLICLLSGVLCIVFGQLLLPLTISTLACIFIFDDEKRRYFGYTLSGLLVILNAAALVLKLSVSFFSIQAIIVAALIAISFVKQSSKAETAFLLTVISSIFIVASAVFLAMTETGVYTIDSVVDFYNNLSKSLREVFSVNAFNIYGDAFATAGVKVTVEDFGLIFDSFLGTVISYIVIFAFGVVGVSFKLFSIITARVAKDVVPLYKWRFMTTNVFAYFYVALVFLSIFIPATDSIFALTIDNTYNIFMTIYAYVGFNVAVSILSAKMKPVFAILVVFAAMLTLFSFAVSVLSLLGVMFTIRKNGELIRKEE